MNYFCQKFYIFFTHLAIATLEMHVSTFFISLAIMRRPCTGNLYFLFPFRGVCLVLAMVYQLSVKQYIVRSNLDTHLLDTPFAIRQPIRRPHLLERVYKPIHTPHWCRVLQSSTTESIRDRV